VKMTIRNSNTDRAKYCLFTSNVPTQQHITIIAQCTRYVAYLRHSGQRSGTKKASRPRTTESSNCRGCVASSCFKSAMPETSTRFTPMIKSPGFKPFSAAHILAADHVVSADHVALGLGETGPIAVVGPAWQLSFFSPNQPAQLVFSLLSTVRARHGVRALFGPFIKKIAFFHPAPRWSAGNFPFASLCHPA